MNCPRCGNSIPDGYNKCDNCGLIFINSNDKNNNNFVNKSDNNNIAIVNENDQGIVNDNISNQNNNGSNQNSINLEGYYVGKNYEKLKKRKWSWSTFVFGFGYTLYRKLILLSLIWISVDVASVIIMGKYSIFVIFGLNFIMSFLFHYIYFALSNNKIDNVKRKYWGHSVDEIIFRVSKKGGTSGLAIFFLIFSVIAAVIVALLLYIVYYPQYYVDKLYFRVPSDFESTSSDTEGKSSFTYSDNVNYCTIVASRENDYNSKDDYINDRIGNKKDLANRNKIKIFGREWDVVDIHFSDNSESYYYVTEKDGVVYNYEFNIYNGFGKKCENYYNYVKYSMTIR